MANNFKIVWNINGKNTIFPVKIAKSVDNEFGKSPSLVCNECKGDLKQKYECVKCEKAYRKGEITHRRDKETKLVFEQKSKQEYIKQLIEQKLFLCEDEIQITELTNYLENLNSEGVYEVFTTDEDYIPYIEKVREFLKLKNVALFGKMGYAGKRRGVLLLSTKDKLTIIPLRDYRLVRQAKQQTDKVVMNEEIENLFKKYSKDQTPELYEEFLTKIKNGEELIVERKEEEGVSPPSFLDEQLALLNK